MKIKLALGGGGVLGAAHLGLLEVLDENNIEISEIAGTSAGAIAGLVYSVGGSKLVAELVDNIDKKFVKDKKQRFLALSPEKFFDEVESTIVEIIGSRPDFKDLPVSFSCIATNITEGEIVVLKSGDALSAVMASSTYPGVFQPRERDGLLLSDGGIMQNLPVSVLKEASSYIVASSLQKITPFKVSPGLISSRTTVATRALDLMMYQLEKREAKNADFLMNPPTKNYRWYSFQAIQEIKKLGRTYAKERKIELLRALDNL